MTGLNLESFLHLLRADLGAWASLGLIALILALMTWTSWGSRRALRKCLVLSIAAHFGLALYGSTIPIVMQAFHPTGKAESERERIQQIQIAPWSETGPLGRRGAKGERGHGTAEYDRPREALALAETKVEATAPEASAPRPVAPNEAELAAATAAPELAAPRAAEPEPIQAAEPEKSAPAPGDPNDVAEPVRRRADPEQEPTPVVLPDRAPRLRAVGERSPKPAPAPLPELPRADAPPLKEPVEARPDAAASPPADPPPVGLAEPKGADVAAPEMAKGGQTAPVVALSDSNLRGGARRPASENAAARIRPRPPAPSPPLVVDPSGAVAEGPRVGPAAPPESAAPLAKPDPAESGVNAVVETRPGGAPAPRPSLPDRDVRRPSRPAGGAPAPIARRPATGDAGALAIARVTPSGARAVPDLAFAPGGRPLRDVPEVYRSRLDPNRTVLAQRAGASAESEQAVERALDWLKRHQDDDGRWDAATAKFDDGTVKKGDDDFTVHCPPGETCFGECLYWEADTALTGLSLLAYLGAGYTHQGAKYAGTVGKGLDFLIKVQKADGDLRGQSRAVGMYCHAMATIALCEAYALSGDESLRPPAEKAVNFLIRGRARDGMSWRYAPGEATGDTSILGWAAMALKSARIVGFAVPASTQTGTLAWLDKVSAGPHKGKARYLPGKPPTPTMTAEAWVCRQFLGAGGPGPASAEAAEYLLEHGPDYDPYNLYYWYYGTLAMYQHGGDPWRRWNGQVRDQVVRRQRTKGHQAGSWDPDDSLYGTTGGRVYCTALATLTLEVYYRFLRLYDEPRIAPARATQSPPSRIGSRP